METQYLSLSGVSELLQVRPHRVAYLLSSKSVAEPKLRIAGKRLWTLEEVAVLADKLLQIAARREHHRRQHE